MTIKRTWNGVTISVVIMVLTVVVWGFLSVFPGLVSEGLSIAILFGTMVALLWYTAETQQVRVAQNLQLELSIKPYLALNRETFDGELQVVNVGNGAAVNVLLEPNPRNDEFGVWMEFPTILALRPGEGTVVAMPVFGTGELANPPVSADLDPKHADQELFITARYSDVMGKAHKQVLFLGFRSVGTGAKI